MAGKTPGPRPKAPKLKGLQGGKLSVLQRRAAGGVELAAAVPGAPEWLTADGREEWDTIVPELDAAGLLSRVDANALALYCHAMAEHRWSVVVIEEEGRTFTSEKGYVGQHPAVAIGHKAREQAYKFLTEFGMTPSSRSRVVASPKAKTSRWEDKGEDVG